MPLPMLEKPISGQPVSRGWFASLYDILMSIYPQGDGRTIRVQVTSKGAIFSAMPQARQTSGGGSSSGSGVIPAKVVSKDGAFYIVDLYANGYDVAATTTNQYASILMLNYADVLPAGTEIIVLSSFVNATGGGNV